MSWTALIIINIICFGSWGFLLKVAGQTLNPRSLLIVEMIGFLVIAAILLFFLPYKLEFHPRGSTIAFAAGGMAAIATIALFMALAKDKASVTITVSALYPIVTIILSLLFLKEEPTLREGVGMALALVAIGLIAH